MAKTAHKGPGKGLSLADVVSLFGTEEDADAWFADCRWDGEPACPKCGPVNVQTGAKHPTMPYRCRSYRKFFSVKTGTAMQSSKLGLRTWAIAIYLLTNELEGRARMKLHRDLGITQKAAWHLAHRLRQAWEDGRVNLFNSPVEVDETACKGTGRHHEAVKHSAAEYVLRGLGGKQIQFADVIA